MKVRSRSSDRLKGAAWSPRDVWRVRFDQEIVGGSTSPDREDAHDGPALDQHQQHLSRLSTSTSSVPLDFQRPQAVRRCAVRPLPCWSPELMYDRALALVPLRGTPRSCSLVPLSSPLAHALSSTDAGHGHSPCPRLPPVARPLCRHPRSLGPARPINLAQRQARRSLNLIFFKLHL